MSDIKVGVIGIGNMGRSNALKLDTGKIKGANLTAVCDINEERLDWAKSNFSREVETFTRPR